MTESGRERRRYPRLNVNASMQACMNEKPFSIQLLDISEGGARFTSTHELPEKLTLTINLALDPVTFPISCLILWHQPQGGRLHMYGCEFISPTPTEVLLLRELVKVALGTPSA